MNYSKAKPLAAKLGVCPKTLARWAASGAIAVYPVNSRVVLYDVAEVEAYIRSAKRGDTPAVRVAIASRSHPVAPDS